MLDLREFLKTCNPNIVFNVYADSETLYEGVSAYVLSKEMSRTRGYNFVTEIGLSDDPYVDLYIEID